jgi:hypothetical protein
METKKERIVTPVGEARWAHVQKPKPAFDERGEPHFQIDVVFDKDDPAWKQWATDLMARVKALPVKLKAGEPMPHQTPIKKEVDQDDQPTGRFFVTFKTGAKFKPGLFDKYGKPLAETVLVGNGSKVRVNYTPSEYEGFGGGIALYLNAVQVLELVEYKAQTADAFGFECEKPVADDPFAEAAPAAKPSETNGSTELPPGAGVPVGDDNIPF